MLRTAEKEYFDKNVTVKDIFKTMLDEMDKKLTPEEILETKGRWPIFAKFCIGK